MPPTDDIQPIKVITLSLTKDSRDALQAELDRYRKTDSDSQKLALIVASHLPKGALEELKSLSRGKENARVVYTITNLPVGDVADISSSYSAFSSKRSIDSIKDLTYSHLISEGIATAMGLKKGASFTLTRYANSQDALAGATPHKHRCDVTMLAGVINHCNAPTRYIDVQGLLTEARAISPDLMPYIKVTQYVAGSNGSPSKEMPLSKLVELLPFWSAQGTEIDMKPITHPQRFESLLQKHSVEVIVGKGEIAIWPEDRGVYHQALSSDDSDISPGYATRIAVASDCHRVATR